tara:strand:- start:1365 stop:1787 length:423 start_codon:yes stop_codon:yes gene_type:complete
MVTRPTRKRMYRTMQGRMVDIEKLRAANETVQAVGNMNVNARGDVLGPGGVIATKKETVIRKYYEQPKGMADDTPARSKPSPAPKTPPKQTVQTMTTIAKTEAKKSAPAPKVETKPVETFKPKAESKAKKGIDAALDGLE